MQRRHLAVAFLVLILALGSAVAAPVPSTGWPIDRAHSRVTFTVTKWGFAEVEGRFLDFAGTLFHDAAHPERSRVDWRVRIASVETGAPKRDEALQGADYFDAARHPEMRFVSERVRPLGAGQLEVQGSLTIRGRTRPLTLRVACGGTHVVPGEGTFEIFQTAFTVDRNAFGVVGGSVLGPAISRDVHVKIIGAAHHR